MKKLNINKLDNLKKGSDLLNDKYGKEGTESRKEFKEKALSFYYGEILKERRKTLNLTQLELAKMIGKERSYIARIEKGETDLRLSNFLQLIAALGLNFNLSE